MKKQTKINLDVDHPWEETKKNTKKNSTGSREQSVEPQE